MADYESFWLWVESELKARGLNYYRIEQDQGLGNATISRPARLAQEPSLTVCKALARAFHLPPEQVLRLAGHLGPAPQTPLGSIPRLQEFVTRLQDLAPREQRLIMETAMMLLEITEGDDADAATETADTPAVLREPPATDARDA